MKRLLLLPLVVLLSSLAMANTPGRKSVLLSWTASTTPGVTYNIYRDTIASVCVGTPTPYATGVTGTSFVDTNVTLGTTYFYNVSAVGSGGESACDGEVTAQVPTITTTPPSNDTATVK
jgi:fibronectin type 3 domain-containing protein